MGNDVHITMECGYESWLCLYPPVRNYIECGTFLVNSYDEGDMTQPFGGYKQSGNAKDKCFESLLSYTNSKAAWFRLN
jgi:acyl-CoA reductase-like NAD-dependent aldehyde dehydrogenase